MTVLHVINIGLPLLIAWLICSAVVTNSFNLLIYAGIIFLFLLVSIVWEESNKKISAGSKKRK